MKQIYKRCLSALLALLLLPGMLPTGIIVRAEAASAEKEAYRKLVQELIHEYGVYDRTLDFLEHPDNSGVADLACIDLTGDGTDELTVVMAEGQGVLSAAIYSYESGSAARIFHTGEVDAVTDFEIRRDSNGNAFLFVSSGKHWYSPYAWKNGAFVTGQLSDADDQQISQAASLGGLMDEGDKRYELQCGKLGIDPANGQEIFLDKDGNRKNLSDWLGNYVYIDVWATWCGPCCRELPAFHKLKEEFKDKPICFVSISIDADEAAWRAKIEKDSLDGIQLRVNEEDTFKKDYKISWIPRFLLIDREGKVLDANMTRPSDTKTIEKLTALLSDR